MENIINRSLFIVKNTTVPQFPNTPEKEKGQIAKGRDNKNVVVPKFKKRPDYAVN